MARFWRVSLLGAALVGLVGWVMPAQAQYQSQGQAQAQAQRAAPQRPAYPGPVYAQSTKATAPAGGQAPAADDPAFWAFSVGWFDVNKQKNEAVEGRIEYRAAEKFWIFKPFGGVMATSDRAFHGYAGVLIDLYFGRRWVLTPSFAPGYYNEGDGKHISSGIQFRSQIELSYRFDNRSRIGVSFNHISNAGIKDPNPGSETLAITYAIPTDKLFKW
jgi:lipid A 3-O-deacylase